MLTIDSAYKFVAKDYKETLMFCLLAAIAVFIPFVGVMLLMGLSVRIISNTINKKNEIPRVFENFWQDVSSGLKYLLFTLVLTTPFMIIFAGSLGGMMTTGVSQDASEIASIFAGMGTSMILAVILIIAYLLVVPALIANYAKEQSFGSFFDINKAFSLVFGNFKAYLKMIGINIIYSIALSIISGIASFTIIVPLLISPLLMLVNGKILGEWYNEVSKK